MFGVTTFLVLCGQNSKPAPVFSPIFHLPGLRTVACRITRQQASAVHSPGHFKVRNVASRSHLLRKKSSFPGRRRFCRQAGQYPFDCGSGSAKTCGKRIKIIVTGRGTWWKDGPAATFRGRALRPVVPRLPSSGLPLNATAGRSAARAALATIAALALAGPAPPADRLEAPDPYGRRNAMITSDRALTAAALRRAGLLAVIAGIFGLHTAGAGSHGRVLHSVGKNRLAVRPAPWRRRLRHRFLRHGSLCRRQRLVLLSADSLTGGTVHQPDVKQEAGAPGSGASVRPPARPSGGTLDGPARRITDAYRFPGAPCAQRYFEGPDFR